ncbi:MAG: transglutaminase-like cysteine peptidase [Micavibrio sp.]
MAAQNQEFYKGVLTGLKIRMHKNRLGELLVLDGVLSHGQLQEALLLSRTSGKQLGRVLTEQNLVSGGAIRGALFEQFMLRLMMAFLTLLISFASMGFAPKARAGVIKDVPARVAFQEAAAIAPMGQYPKLFGSMEKKSRSLSAFTKWTGMFERFDAALNTSNGQQAMNNFKSQIEFLRGLPMGTMVSSVNEIVNKVPYRNDRAIYGVNDYWATPMEFLQNGGDCEDYAITKYVALRALGVPEERMRILILQDLQKNIPHAVLVVYTENGAMVLDNQIKSVTNVERIAHYKPIFSINRTAWWLHTKPSGTSVTTVASAAR